MADLIITTAPLIAEPLPIGELAPDFALAVAQPSGDGSVQKITRQQYRGKNGLMLLFVADYPPAIHDRLTGIAQDADRYAKLNVKLLVIVPSSTAADQLPDLPFPVLVDSDGQTWQHYRAASPNTESVVYRYGLFMLDRYGGVDSQLITDQAEALPDAETALGWARYATYKCVC